MEYELLVTVKFKGIHFFFSSQKKFSQTLNMTVRASAEFETNITSAERIEEYCNTPHEVSDLVVCLR